MFRVNDKFGVIGEVAPDIYRAHSIADLRFNLPRIKEPSMVKLALPQLYLAMLLGWRPFSHVTINVRGVEVNYHKGLEGKFDVSDGTGTLPKVLPERSFIWNFMDSSLDPSNFVQGRHYSAGFSYCPNTKELRLSYVKKFDDTRVLAGRVTS